MTQMTSDPVERRELSLSAIKLLGLRTARPITNTTSEIMVSCPFHKDKTPSMGINLKKGVCNCFSCNFSGSVEKLYKTITGQSLREVSGLNGDSFSSYRPLNLFNTPNWDDNSLKSVFITYNKQDFISIENSFECLNYLESRGIPIEVAHNMKMMYCEDSRINGTRFYRRLIIPIYENGKLISFEGRRIFKEDPDPKVLYPKNCTVNSLYDIDNLNKEKRVFAVEGLMDLAVLRSNEFFKNSTAIFGAKLTHRQLYLFRKFKQVIYIPDLDAAGEETLEKFKNAKLDNIYVLAPPKEINGVSIKDVGDIPKSGITIQQLLNNRWMDYVKKLDFASD